MAFECRVECDSVSPDGVRLVTFVVTFPRFILAEVNTHRMLSRNSASSRAVPLWKRIAAVCEDPYVPARFGAEQAGMQAGAWLEGADHDLARDQWLRARNDAVVRAANMLSLEDRRKVIDRLSGLALKLVLAHADGFGPSVSVHKSWLNRLLEPFSWHTAILSATDWNNFFAQRCHKDAQPEFRTIAEMMQGAMKESVPQALTCGQWHLPFVTAEELAEVCAGGEPARERYKLISVGRCARVSYLNHDGARDPEADVKLAQRLMDATPKHASPFEMVATPFVPTDERPRNRGNFFGWLQFRHTIPNESVPG